MPHLPKMAKGQRISRAALEALNPSHYFDSDGGPVAVIGVPEDGSLAGNDSSELSSTPSHSSRPRNSALVVLLHGHLQ